MGKSTIPNYVVKSQSNSFLYSEGGTTQGTEDIYGTKGYSLDPQAAARQLHVNWEKILNTNPTPPKDQWPPYVEKLNAESYAASVTEWWFMSKCNFDSIIGN